MAYDELQILQTPVTTTGTQNGPALNLRNGTPKRGMVARIVATTVTTSAIFKVQHSIDNATWDDLAFCEQGVVTAAGEYDIRFSTDRQYARLVGIATGSLTYSAELGIAFP